MSLASMLVQGLWFLGSWIGILHMKYSKADSSSCQTLVLSEPKVASGVISPSFCDLPEKVGTWPSDFRSNLGSNLAQKQCYSVSPMSLAWIGALRLSRCQLELRVLESHTVSVWSLVGHGADPECDCPPLHLSCSLCPLSG